MKYLIALLLFSSSLAAQVPYNGAIPNGYTKKALVGEQVGLTQVTITYHRPVVNGREGNVWGKLVHTGFADQGFGNRKPAPWRAGANENTIIENDNDVKVEGQLLPKGKYGFFIAYGPDECTLIFSRKSDGWGSFYYEEKDDVLRVKVKPEVLQQSIDHLTFAFTKQSPNSAVIVLSWEKLAIPFKIEVDLLKDQYEAITTELKNPRSYTTQALTTAANWALQNNYALEQALQWATAATSPGFPGDPSSFTGLMTKANILNKMGRSEEADAVIKTALQFGNSMQLLQLGRQMINEKKIEKAFEVLKYNYNRDTVQFVSNIGMARAWSSKGEYAKALVLVKRALPLAPNEQNKKSVMEMIGKLENSKDIN